MKGHLARVFAGLPLSEEQAAEVMGLIMDGDATPAQIGALLAALAVRGESEDELVGFARAMRERALPLRSAGAVDTCGTGGDGAATFNVSTVASLAVAACGVPVAKHGNRSASGSCGSADLLEGLGLRLEAPLESVQRAFDEAGWTFLFAPAFHLLPGRFARTTTTALLGRARRTGRRHSVRNYVRFIPDRRKAKAKILRSLFLFHGRIRRTRSRCRRKCGRGFLRNDRIGQTLRRRRFDCVPRILSAFVLRHV